MTIFRTWQAVALHKAREELRQAGVLPPEEDEEEGEGEGEAEDGMEAMLDRYACLT